MDKTFLEIHIKQNLLFLKPSDYIGLLKIIIN